MLFRGGKYGEGKLGGDGVKQKRKVAYVLGEEEKRGCEKPR